MERCTFDGNTAPRGSALFNVGTAEIRNTTFVGDITAGIVTAGAIQNRGTLVAVHFTVTSNGRGGVGGIDGLFAFNASTTRVTSNIAERLNTDCTVSNGSTTTIGLPTRNGHCTRQFNANPRCGGLADHGGPTPTVALGSGSPALDVADPSLCLPADRRGVARPQGAGCDPGAFEVDVLSPSNFGDGFETEALPDTAG